MSQNSRSGLLVHNLKVIIIKSLSLKGSGNTYSGICRQRRERNPPSYLEREKRNQSRIAATVRSAMPVARGCAGKDGGAVTTPGIRYSTILIRMSSLLFSDEKIYRRELQFSSTKSASDFSPELWSARVKAALSFGSRSPMHLRCLRYDTWSSRRTRSCV